MLPVPGPDNVVGLLRSNLGPNADAWFDAIVSGDIVEAKRPSPEVYKKVIKRLNLPPRDCLSVEDSAHGLASSLAAGIPTVVMLNDYARDEDFRRRPYGPA